MSSNEYMVDITVLCYNHEKYVKKCLESILSQITSFRYRIFIGDDCSTDSSPTIIQEFAEKYPDIVFPILNTVNLGVSQNGLQLKKLCTSKYIVGAESDDYWIDDYRLQKQFDFLETHPEYVAVGCNYVNVDPNGDNPYKALLPWQVNKSYCMNDYLHFGFIVHGSTLMCRNVLDYHSDRYQKMMKRIPTMGDVIKRVRLYDVGKIYCLNDVMHAHRMGANDKSSFYSVSRNDPIKYCYMYNDIVDALNDYFSNKYNLNGLITGRMGLVIFWKWAGVNNYDKSKFIQYMKGLPLHLRIACYYRAALKGWRSLIHIIGRKLFF